jgi:hypothetical protein
MMWTNHEYVAPIFAMLKTFSILEIVLQVSLWILTVLFKASQKY